MLNPKHFRQHVIDPALRDLDMYSEAASNLLLGTALTESGLTYLVQNGGPALGVYQIEPDTHDDIWANFLKYRKTLSPKVRRSGGYVGTDHDMLIWNLKYATAIARLVYWRRPEPLPKADDAEGLAAYWKAHFNTSEGKGSVEKALPHFERAIKS